MKVDKLHAFILLLITMVLSYSLLPWYTGVGHDKQVFIYGAMAIWKGEIPYKSFFDHKPPLIFLLLALAWPFKAWGYYFLGVVTKWIAGLFLYRLAKHFKLDYPLLYPVVFLICLLPPFVLMAGLLTREFAACFLAILFSVILLYPGKKYIVTGLLCALVFHMQQEELLLAFPLVMYKLFYKEASEIIVAKIILKRILLMALGFFIVTAPLLLWIAAEGGLSAYWEQSYLFNFFVYESRRPVLYKITGTLSVLFHTRFLFLIFPLLLLHLYFILKKVNAKIHLVLFFTLALGLCVKTFAGRIIDYIAIYHYLLTFSAVVAVAVIVVAIEFKKQIAPAYFKPAALIGTMGLFFLMWKNSFPGMLHPKKSEIASQVNELSEQLQELKNKDGQLFVMGHTPFIALNNNLNALSPSKWIYTTQYSQRLVNFDEDGHVIREIMADLERNKTMYVLDFYLIHPVDRKSFQEQWEQYVKRHYTEVYRKNDYILFKRNSNATP